MVFDLTAGVVLLLIERFLLLFGDMAMVLRSHIAFFLADLMVVAFQAVSLCLAHLAVLYLVVDPAILVVETVVDFGTTGVGLVKFTRLGKGGGGEGQHGDREDA